MDKEFPVLYGGKEECCGCMACYAICPQKAVNIARDEEGFDYPHIDTMKCVCCYKCIKVCPIKAMKTSK
ncbi:4Fe-4S dicluster domain-containing protein [Lachnospiraceae bacterium NLAE-zl-G231]|nr:4Fe-4S dicluster domain-containing protein [Lachnospiraceae bacterium NLAE-zl-G231]